MRFTNLDRKRIGLSIVLCAAAASCNAILGVGGDWTEKDSAGAGGSGGSSSKTTSSSSKTSTSSSGGSSTSSNGGGGATSSSATSSTGGGASTSSSGGAATSSSSGSSSSSSTGGTTCSPLDVNGVDSTIYDTGGSAFGMDFEDLSTHVLRAYVPNGGGYTVINGSGALGGFTIPQVPCGDYLLSLDDQTFWLLDNEAGATPDLGQVVLGREMEIPATQMGTTVQFTGVTGMSPWAMGTDALEFMSVSVGAFGGNVQKALAPSSGATTLAGSVAYGPVSIYIQPTNLVQDDTFSLLHLTQQTTTQGTQYLTSTQVAFFNGYTFMDGISNVVMGGAFNGALTNESFDLNLTLSPFEMIASAMNPGRVTLVQHNFFIDALFGPADGSFGQVGGTPDLVRLFVTPGSTLPSIDTLTYGDPYTANHADAALYSMVATLPWQLSGTTGIDTDITAVISQDVASNVSGQAIQPLYGAIHTATIDGNNFFMDQTTGTSLTPTLSWAAPPSMGGQPTRYKIILDKLGKKNGVTTVIGVASFFVPANVTSLQIPSGLMLSGDAYAFIISAQYAPTSQWQQHLRMLAPMPFYGTAIASGIYQL